MTAPVRTIDVLREARERIIGVLATPGCTCATCEYIRAQSKPPISAWPQPSTPSIVGYRCANCGQWATGLHSCTVCADSRAAEGDGGK